MRYALIKKAERPFETVGLIKSITTHPFGICDGDAHALTSDEAIIIVRDGRDEKYLCPVVETKVWRLGWLKFTREKRCRRRILFASEAWMQRYDLIALGVAGELETDARLP